MIWQHPCQSTLSKHAMTDFTAAGSKAETRLTYRKGREIVVEEETFFTFSEKGIDPLFVI